MTFKERVILWIVTRRLKKAMKQWTIAGISVANIVAIILQVLSIFPMKPWVVGLQAILQALLPSVGGVGHAVVFGEKQVK